MSRRTVGHLILLAWVATLGWLAARHLLTPAEQRLERGAARIGPSSSFLAVLLGAHQVGTGSIQLDTLPTGFRYAEHIAVDVRDPDGTVRRLLSRIEATTSRAFRLRSVRASWNDTGRDPALLEAREELGSDSTLVVRLLRQPRDVEVIAVPRAAGLVLSGTRPFQLAASARLQAGRSLATEAWYPLRLVGAREALRIVTDSGFQVSDSAALDPASGRWITVVGPEVQAWRIEGTVGGLPATLWIDAQGRTLRREHAFGLTLERSPFEVNYTNYQTAFRQGTAPPPLRLAASRLLVPSKERPPDGPDVVTVVISRVDGSVPSGAVSALAGGRQLVTGDTVRIFRHGSPGGSADAAGDDPLRGTGGWIPATDLPVLREALHTALAGSASVDTVSALLGWVAQDVRLSTSLLDPAGPGRTARLRRGGVDAKARLLAALYQVAGIPARVVSGLDLSQPDLPAHTWVEVWRDGWAAVDPAAGTAPASPWLLRVAEGAARPAELVVLVGALRVSVLTTATRGRVR